MRRSLRGTLRAPASQRAAHRIVCELEADGYLTRHRIGARNYYEVHPDRPLRHEAEAGIEVGQLLEPLLARQDQKTERAA